MNKNIVLLFILFSTISLAETKIETTYLADLPPKGQDISYNKDGHIVRITTSTWVDRVKTKDGLKYHKFEQGFDYKLKQGFIKVYDENGKLINEKWNKDISGGVAQEELLNAFALFKKHKTIQTHFKETDKKISIYGGFNFSDNKQCKLGNRCVHVMASTVDNPMLAHAIVRLIDSKVVYPDFDMDKSKWTIPHQKVSR
ncbi:MAG TPA: hypothetical protein ENJ44_05400 [Oceanospirillales bacterium]|nr:hypothetical protein [Oceanospirillales bacterium]